MDSEFQRLLTAVVNGTIRDTDRIREIIVSARTAVEAKRESVDQMQALLFEAQEAFVTGWNVVRC